MNLPSPDLNNSSVISFELSLFNELADLERLNPWLEECAEMIGLSARGSFRLQLLLEEIAMNVFENAYADVDEAEHLMLIRLTAEDFGVVIRIEDDGMPFDPTAYPEPEFATDLEDVQIGGLGLHLVRSYADEYIYQRVGNKNILVLKILDQGETEDD